MTSLEWIVTISRFFVLCSAIVALQLFQYHCCSAMFLSNCCSAILAVYWYCSIVVKLQEHSCKYAALKLNMSSVSSVEGFISSVYRSYHIISLSHFNWKVYNVYDWNISMKHCGQLECHALTECLIFSSCFGGFGRPITALWIKYDGEELWRQNCKLIFLKKSNCRFISFEIKTIKLIYWWLYLHSTTFWRKNI